MTRIFGNGKPQPRKCPDCNARLQDARYVRVNVSWNLSDSVWRIDYACGTALTWSYPQEWKRSHPLPLVAALTTANYANKEYHEIVMILGKEMKG